MPFASPSRYQSRLFKFFHRQSQRASDRIQRTLRQVQVSTSWSIEALLFLIVKKVGDLAGKQLNAQNQKNHILQTTLTADSPIVNMLQMVKNLPSRHVTDIKLKEQLVNYIEYHQTDEVNEIVKASLPAVQGIASHLGNRHLVLVTVDNKIIDILTLKQQQRLQDRIITEIADYWRLRRKTFDNQVDEGKKLLPEIETLLRKLTGSNPSLPGTGIVSLDKEVKSNLVKSERLELIDAAIAKLESSTLVPILRTAITLQQASSQFLVAVRGKFNLFLYGNEITPSHGIEELENQTPQISALIWQAINHFFGNSIHQAIAAKQNNSSSQGINKKLSPGQAIFVKTLPKAVLSKSRHESKNNENNHIENPWLTFDDLFAEDSPIANESVTQQNLPISSNQSEMRLPSKYPNPRFLTQYQAGGELVTQPKSSQAVVVSSRKSGSIIGSQQSKSKISILDNRSHHSNIHDEAEFTSQPETDFIEINASTVGYDKHPLELALEWLDSLLLWLEEKFVKAIRWIQQLWKK